MSPLGWSRRSARCLPPATDPALFGLCSQVVGAIGGDVERLEFAKARSRDFSLCASPVSFHLSSVQRHWRAVARGFVGFGSVSQRCAVLLRSEEGRFSTHLDLLKRVQATWSKQAQASSPALRAALGRAAVL